MEFDTKHFDKVFDKLWQLRKEGDKETIYFYVKKAVTYDNISIDDLYKSYKPQRHQALL